MNTRHLSRWFWPVLILAASAVPFIAPVVYADPVSGIVVDCKNNAIEGVLVMLFKVEGSTETPVGHDTSDANGVFDYNLISKGTYNVLAICPDGSRAVSTNFNVPGDKSHVLRLRCCPKSSASSTSSSNASVKTAGGLSIGTSYDATPGPGYVGTFSIASNGLRIVNFDTSAGRVKVSLPDDMRAGDTISGTVVVEPKGNSDQERAKNRSELNGYVVELMPPASPRSGNAPAQSGPANRMVISSNQDTNGWPVKWDIGEYAGQKGPTLAGISLKDRNGSVIGTTTIPIAGTVFAPPQGAIIIATQDIGFPTMHIVMRQQGRPVEIPGAFDGNAENTRVQIGGQEVPVLAESPRKTIFQSPTSPTGQTEIVVREGKTETKGPYRNVGVNLTAPKTTLLKGESTTLKVEVSGLEGIKEPVPLHLTKGGVVTMQGGDVQTMSIKPAEVQANGTFTTTRTITGVQAGAWNATATVVVFNFCLQDDNSGDSVIFSSDTGDYFFCPGNTTGNQGVGKGMYDWMKAAFDKGYFAGGNIVRGDGKLTLEHATPEHRLLITANGGAVPSGTATIQTANPKQTFTITDRDTRNNVCTCK